MAEIIYLQTKNTQKLEEYQRILGRHRLTVLRASHQDSVDELFQKTQKGHLVRAVMREESNLYLPKKKEPVSIEELKDLLHRALNLGPFFRAPSNRRENIYWNPGGNGGIPYTPKINKLTGIPDAIHETTYFVHDLNHHILMPDLVFEGTTDPLERRIQIICRMMSEALTLVAADMLFVDTLVRSGASYDFEKRKIYPLFTSCRKDFLSDPATS